VGGTIRVFIENAFDATVSASEVGTRSRRRIFTCCRETGYSRRPALLLRTRAGLPRQRRVCSRCRCGRHHSAAAAGAGGPVIDDYSQFDMSLDGAK
jgi:hypothetical protein